MLGEAAALVLVPELLAVREHREFTATAGNEAGVDAVFLLDGGCETRSLRLVVSLHAVANFDFHGTPLLGNGLQIEHFFRARHHHELAAAVLLPAGVVVVAGDRIGVGVA